MVNYVFTEMFTDILSLFFIKPQTSISIKSNVITFIVKNVDCYFLRVSPFTLFTLGTNKNSPLSLVRSHFLQTITVREGVPLSYTLYH